MSVPDNNTRTPETPRASDRVCASCAGQAAGWGIVAKYTPRGQTPKVFWCCGEPDCFLATTGTFTMPDKEFKRLEQIATVRGGEEAGQYLDEIGKSDLATLEPEEWAIFCMRLVGGYRHALHVELREASPF